MKNKLSTSKILKNPLIVLIFMGFGIYIGIKYPLFSKKISSFGELYIKLLKLTVLPILFTVIVSSISGLVRSANLKKYIFKMLIVFSITLVFISGLGTLAGIIGKPGSNLTMDQSISINKIIDNSEHKLVAGFLISNKNDNIVFDLLNRIITDNIFSSLNNDNYIKVILFSLLLGLAIGLIKKEQSDMLINVFDGLFTALQKIFDWILQLLPIGIFCLAANQAANIGSTVIFGAVSKFIGIFYILSGIIFLTGIFIIWIKSKQSLLVVIKGLAEPVLISISTNNSLVALPSSIKVMSQHLKFNKDSSNFFIPISQTLGQYGNILFFALASVFACQLSDVIFNFNIIMIIVFGSILAGISTAGSSGYVAISFLTIILLPLKLPAESVLLLLISIDVVIAPVRKLMTVFINLIANAFVSKPNSYVSEEKVPGVLLQNIPEDINLRSYFREYDGELPLINLVKSDFLISVFPKAKFKSYKNWESVEIIWNSYDANIIVGEKEYLRNISDNDPSDTKFVILNKIK